jgi:DnaJ family protein C protein 7
VEKDASESEIKKGYRKMAVKWHPDKQEQADEEAMAQADKMFKDIGEAYAVLSDPKKKQMYDEGADIEEIDRGG